MAAGLPKQSSGNTIGIVLHEGNRLLWAMAQKEALWNIFAYASDFTIQGRSRRSKMTCTCSHNFLNPCSYCQGKADAYERRLRRHESEFDADIAVWIKDCKERLEEITRQRNKENNVENNLIG